MKTKLLIGVLLGIFVINCSAISTNEVQLLNDFGNKIDSYIQVASQKLGQGVDHFYPILVKQQVIAGISEISAWLFAALVNLTLYLCVRYSKCKVFDNDVNYIQFVFGIALVYSVILLFWFICSIPDSIRYILNPEYYAFKDIMDLIRK